MARSNQLDPTDYNTLVGFDGDWRDTWWNQDYLVMTARRLGLDRARSVLDVGCGVGHWGLRLLDLCAPDATLHGVDRERSFVERARERAGDRPATFAVAHGEQLVDQVGGRTFDLVTCQTVLMHVEDAAEVIDQMVAVLRPGGSLLVAEPDNTANSVATIARAQRDRDTLLAALELHFVCRDGKEALGHGDDDVGNRLVELFHAAGLVDIDCRSNDRCAFLIPPYDDPRQALDLAATTREGLEVRRELFRTRFMAGGGDPERFDALWAADVAALDGRLGAIAAGTHITSGGFVHYLASGRRRR